MPNTRVHDRVQSRGGGSAGPGFASPGARPWRSAFCSSSGASCPSFSRAPTPASSPLPAVAPDDAVAPALVLAAAPAVFPHLDVPPGTAGTVDAPGVAEAVPEAAARAAQRAEEAPDDLPRELVGLLDEALDEARLP
jgi:hypothetical protein